jgi:hypothetical protein
VKSTPGPTAVEGGRPPSKQDDTQIRRRRLWHHVICESHLSINRRTVARILAGPSKPAQKTNSLPSEHPKGATPGDKCFVYKLQTGIVLYFEIVRVMERRSFCDGFSMATAEVKILKVFRPPITPTNLKSSPQTREEGFARCNFQGKAFALQARVAENILSVDVAENPA